MTFCGLWSLLIWLILAFKKWKNWGKKKSKVRAFKSVKTVGFETRNSPTLISRKIWSTENSVICTVWKIKNSTHLNQFKKRLKKALSGHLTGRDTQRVDIGTLMRNAQHIGSISYDTASDLFNLLKYGRLFLFKKLIMVCSFHPK